MVCFASKHTAERRRAKPKLHTNRFWFGHGREGSPFQVLPSCTSGHPPVSAAATASALAHRFETHCEVVRGGELGEKKTMGVLDVEVR